MKRAIWGLLAVCLTAGCGGDDEDRSSETREVTGLDRCTVKQKGYYYIAEYLPFSGSLSAYGTSGEKAILLAIDEINRAGGVHGRKLGLVACDEAGEATTGTAAAAEIAGLSPVSAAVGGISSAATIPASAEFVAAEKPLVVVAATSPAISDLADNGFIFRAALSDAFQGVVAAAIAKADGRSKVFVLHRNDAYGNGLAEVFMNSFVGSGREADDFAYSESVNGYETMAIEAAMAYNPDAVYVVSFNTDGAALLKKAASVGWTTPKWILCEVFKDPQIPTAVANNAYLTGQGGTAPLAPSGARFETFRSAFKSAYGEEPTLSAPQAYDATYLMAIAMALAADPDQGAQIRDALSKTHGGQKVGPGQWEQILSMLGTGEIDYDGASGPVDFDAKGDVLSLVQQWRWSASGAVEHVGCWNPEGTLGSCPQ
jgi:branched-chain amino acid transport system substrate-binding protein